MKVIVTGSTGMVGKGVLLECLEQPEISNILSITRRSTGISHPKFTELIHPDFSEFDSINEKLHGYDACFACMGVSSAGMNEGQYKIMTYDYTLALARTLFGVNKSMTFIYVSGVGTDSSEKGKLMWARVKGKTENDILKLGFRQAFMFRPGAIIPKRGVKPSSKFYRFLLSTLSWLLVIIKKISPQSVVDTDQIGRAMITASISGFEKAIISPVDIQILAGDK